MRPATAALPLTDSQRQVLDKLARSQAAPQREVTRAKALLLAGDGLANTAIAARLGVSPASVAAWRGRVVGVGRGELGRGAPGRGRGPVGGAGEGEWVGCRTFFCKPAGSAPGAVRAMRRG